MVSVYVRRCLSVQGDGFDERLEAARQRAGLDAAKPVRRESDRGSNPLSFAFRLGAEMIGSLFVACALGWGLDHLLGTRPWFMVGLLPIGVAAGVMNLLRASSPKTAGDGMRGGPPRGRGLGNEDR